MNSNTLTVERVDGWWYWWPLLFGPASMALIYVAYVLQWSLVLDAVTKPTQEQLALILTALAFGGFAGRFGAGRNPIHLILGALSFTFFCREVHFSGTSAGVYVALVLIVAWSFHWRRRLVPLFFEGQFRFWLLSTFAMYALSQVIARPALRFLPYESELHVPWEEMVENAAHAMLFVTSLVGSRRADGRGEG